MLCSIKQIFSQTSFIIPQTRLIISEQVYFSQTCIIIYEQVLFSQQMFLKLFVFEQSLFVCISLKHSFT